MGFGKVKVTRMVDVEGGGKVSLSFKAANSLGTRAITRTAAVMDSQIWADMQAQVKEGDEIEARLLSADDLGQHFLGCATYIDDWRKVSS